MEQRSLRISENRIIYCYSDGSIEYLSKAPRHYKNPLLKVFGHNDRDSYKTISIDGKTYKVHRLIAMAFHSNPLNLPQVDHINRNRSDNRPENLRWVTPRENQDNQAKVDESISKFGVRWCEDKKAYYKARNDYYKFQKT